ncbi:MAG: GAF domain-containing protein [Desulfobacterales bacterium]|nr:GAF domain-containing protein [Desulfobacterales bacterium]
MERETSCINSRAILDYVKHHRPDAVADLIRDLDPEIDALPDPEAFLRDPHNWISSRLIAKLFARTRQVLGDEEVAFKIARYAFENKKLGYGQRIFFKALWSTNNVLNNLQRVNNKWNRNKRVEVVARTRKGALVRLHWKPEMNCSRDMCLYNQGAYTYLPVVWGGKPVKVIEHSCFFEGAPYCEYDLIKAPTNRFYEIFSRIFTSKSVLMETVQEMEKDKEIIEKKYKEVNQLNIELNQKIRQLTAVQETGKAILSILDLNRLLSVIMNILRNVCRINRALIMLVKEEENCLQYLYGSPFEGDISVALRSYSVPLDRVSNILARVASTGKPEYVDAVKSSLLQQENILLRQVKPSSVYVTPLITRSKVIGIIAIDGPGGQGIPAETRETLEVFTPQIAIAIENARLYRQLQEQMKHLKRSQALLSRAEKFSFLGNLAARLAHEIKNPMTAIGTFIQMLPGKFDDAEFRNKFYEIAREETERVNRLITELLDLVKTRESHFNRGNLHHLIDRMVLLVSPQSHAKDIRIECDYDPQIHKVWMDQEKMKEVVLNLLSNAVEFTPENGRIRIATSRIMKNGRPGGVKIELEDNGIGIPENQVKNVFDPYFTTKHKSDMHSGTGLGLFVSHQNMQDQGGTIEVESLMGRGARFVLKLPDLPKKAVSGDGGTPAGGRA